MQTPSRLCVFVFGLTYFAAFWGLAEDTNQRDWTRGWVGVDPDPDPDPEPNPDRDHDHDRDRVRDRDPDSEGCT